MAGNIMITLFFWKNVKILIFGEFWNIFTKLIPPTWCLKGSASQSPSLKMFRHSVNSLPRYDDFKASLHLSTSPSPIIWQLWQDTTWKPFVFNICTFQNTEANLAPVWHFFGQNTSRWLLQWIYVIGLFLLICFSSCSFDLFIN